MREIQKSENQIQKLKIRTSEFVYSKDSSIKSRLVTCVVVIILTLAFNFLYEWNENSHNLYLLLLLCVCCYCFGIRYSEYKSRKKILESIPQFLSLLIMTMGMGKSFRYAFEKVLHTSKGGSFDFYNEVFKKIFVLREQKSCFGVQDLDTFYENLFDISQKTSYQIPSLKSFHAQWQLKEKNLRKKQAIMMPVWIQAVVLCLLFISAQAWNVLNGTLIVEDMLLTAVWYAIGLYILLKQQSVSEKRI